MIAIINYGLGNLFSLQSSFEAIGEEVIVTGDPEEIARADRLLLPGVGAFRDAALLLAQTGLGEVVHEEAVRGKPILGICLGMQLLLDHSYEYGDWDGLGLIPGAICPIKDSLEKAGAPDLLIPQIGWNALTLHHDHPLFADTHDGDHVYFVHSYHAVTDPQYVIATTEYGATLTAAVAKDNVMGCQFHPEKSGSVGLSILRRFCAL